MSSEMSNEMSYKVVVAKYSCQDIFKIPKNVNLDDETIVKNWSVRWNKLHIYFVDGKMLEIESEGMGEIDYKYPDNTVIEDGGDYGMDEEEFQFYDCKTGELKDE